MPFTLAHPAAVLPLRRLGLPATALVVGSMVPDLPVFDRTLVAYRTTHSWVGVVTIDPLLAVLVCALWYAVLRDALVDLAPSAVRTRVAPHVALTRWQWLLVPVAASVGAATHVVWDAFTHGGRWGVALVPWLQQVHDGRVGHQWAQLGSGVVGLLVLTLAAASWLRRQPVVRRPRLLPPRRVRLAGASMTAVVLVAGGTALAAAAAARGNRHDMVFGAVVEGLIALAVGLVLVAGLWRLLVVEGRATAG